MRTRIGKEAMPLDSERKVSCIDDPAGWVDRYGDTLLRFALARVDQREVAEDLVQETFLAAWKGRRSFDGRSSLGTWLCGILRRKAADYHRRAGKERMLAEQETEDATGPLFSKRGKWLESIAGWRQSPAQLAENSEFWGVMADCLAGLPAHLAEAFQLREIRLARMEDICAIADITPKNLSVRLHRARLLLRRCLDQKWFRGDILRVGKQGDG